MASALKNFPVDLLDNIHVLDRGGFVLNDFIQDEEIEAQLKFGMIANFITTGYYPVPPRIIVNPFERDKDNNDKDPVGTKAKQSKADDRVTEKMVQWEFQMPAMIQCMLKYIRPVTRTKIKEDVGHTIAVYAAAPLEV